MNHSTDSFDETTFTFECGQSELVGIHHQGHADNRTGILIVVGGRQYRAGAHRQFTLLARHLSLHGFPVLRFDVRGMGDSSGSQRHFLELDQDIRQAVKELKSRSPQITKVMLWGLCDGASAAVLSAAGIPVVAAVLMVNPWITTDSSAARVQLKHYYRKRIFSGSFWNKLVGGEVNWVDSIFSLFSTLSKTLMGSTRKTQTTLPEIVMNAIAQFSGSTCILISDRDITAREFEEEYAKRLEQSNNKIKNVVLTRIAADHTFSTPEEHELLCKLTLEFAESLTH